MSTTTPNMGLKAPSAGDAAATYVPDVQATVALIDAHDHSPGKGAPIPQSALAFTGDVDVSGQKLTHVRAVGFNDAGALLSGSGNPRHLFAYNGELYYNNAAGQSVKITSGAQLNAAVMGGIGGDYTAVGALVSYDAATSTYRLRTPGGTRASLDAQAVSVATAASYAHLSQTVTYVAHVLRGAWDPSTAAISVLNGRVVLPAAVPGTSRYTVTLPTPNAGTVTGVRLYVSYTGSLNSGAARVLYQSRTTAAVNASSAQALGATGTGPTILSFSGLSQSCVGQTFAVELTVSTIGGNAQVTVLSAEIDVTQANLSPSFM